ncbi:Eid1-like f-box protein [Thalictrum thalictroides]|uniref:Eid1-like f-box protein n=1 Tax=Thalictrum thalictroides TaxID=46969 RepID=A0A7J6VZD8_THATH|nr:Eid1-like f-box protein [Thalictrum thalictroides]
MIVSRRHKPNRLSEISESTADSGLLNERILLLIFRSVNWDPHLLCLISCVTRKLNAVAKRVLWKELCASRASRMVSTLVNGEPKLRVGDGWHALAKLMFYCCGCVPSRHFRIDQSLPGHFVKLSRFSKTSGQSFLTKRCQSDLLYVSDPCEHTMRGNIDDLGIFRGVIRGFMKSKTRAYLIKRQIEFEQQIRCPYCGQRVWSMTTARLVPKSAATRLGSHHEKLEYFVCVNGHLHGACLLVPLSSDDNHDLDDGEEENGVHHHHHDQMAIRAGLDGKTSSSGEQIWDGSSSTTRPQVNALFGQ